MASSPDGPSDPADDLDAQWADLTARLGPLGTSAWDDLEDPPDSASDITELENSAVPASPARPSGPRDYEHDDEGDDGGRFVPPDPGPVITGASRNTLPWIGAIGGPLAVLAMLILWPTAPPAAYLTALAAAITGLVVLWWRLPVHKNGEDDDGAVV